MVRYLEVVRGAGLKLPDQSAITLLDGDLQKLRLETDDERESLSTYRTERDVGEILHPTQEPE